MQAYSKGISLYQNNCLIIRFSLKITMDTADTGKETPNPPFWKEKVPCFHFPGNKATTLRIAEKPQFSKYIRDLYSLALILKSLRNGDMEFETKEMGRK